MGGIFSYFFTEEENATTEHAFTQTQNEQQFEDLRVKSNIVLEEVTQENEKVLRTEDVSTEAVSVEEISIEKKISAQELCKDNKSGYIEGEEHVNVDNILIE
jgi:hypothetical protein